MPDLRSLTLYIVRHGECRHNLQGRFAGQDDSPLTETGQSQARENGLVLKRLLGADPALDFIASPLHRAAATMELLRGAMDLPAQDYRADRRLMELDVGDQSGWPIKEVLATPEYAAYIRDPWNYVRPGGESHAALHRRVGDFLASLTRDAVLVCHAGSARMLRAHCLGLDPSEALNWEPSHAGIILLSKGREERVEAGNGPMQPLRESDFNLANTR